MGVWIEINKIETTNHWLIVVTPCVGVWIEIVLLQDSDEFMTSLPAWECGLKFRPS